MANHDARAAHGIPQASSRPSSDAGARPAVVAPRAVSAADTPALMGWGRLAAPGREGLGEALVKLPKGAAGTGGLGGWSGHSSLRARADDKVGATRMANR